MNVEFVQGVVGSHNVIADEKPQYAFVGCSNVGKSSVINMLVERTGLVRTSSTPGKTQQINYFLVEDSVYFVDLPGYGYARLGQKYREKLRRLILWYLISGEAPITKVVLIVDLKAGLREFDHEMIGILREYEHPFVVVANKMDKLNQKGRHKALEKLEDIVGHDAIIVPASAASKKGRREILDAMGVDF